MEPIKIDDHWVRKQLTDCFTFRQKLGYELKHIMRQASDIFGPSVFSIPSASMAQSIKLIAGLIRRDIEERGILISHRKILESRGLGSIARNLQSIIEHLPDFQAYIYATDEFFRDHIEHQIRVAVLGNYLLSQRFDSPTGSKRLVDTLSSILGLSEDDTRKAWWIAGLFHDIGMPIEKLARNFSKVIREDLASAYENLDLNTPKINDPIPDLNSNKFFFEKLTSDFTPATKKCIETALGWVVSTKIDHGAVGALALLRSIPDVQNGEEDKMSTLLDSEYKPYLISARAVMIHSLFQKDNSVEIRSDHAPLAYLLVCCDEMQEWGREVNIKERSLLDPYFHRDQLVKHCLLSVSNNELELSFEYKNQKAKDNCHFAFDYYFADKEKNIERLNNEDHVFPRLSIEATDFVFDQKELIRTIKKKISKG